MLCSLSRLNPFDIWRWGALTEAPKRTAHTRSGRRSETNSWKPKPTRVDTWQRWPLSQSTRIQLADHKRGGPLTNAIPAEIYGTRWLCATKWENGWSRSGIRSLFQAGNKNEEKLITHLAQTCDSAQMTCWCRLHSVRVQLVQYVAPSDALYSAEIKHDSTTLRRAIDEDFRRRRKSWRIRPGVRCLNTF